MNNPTILSDLKTLKWGRRGVHGGDAHFLTSPPLQGVSSAHKLVLEPDSMLLCRLNCVLLSAVAHFTKRKQNAHLILWPVLGAA